MGQNKHAKHRLPVPEKTWKARPKLGDRTLLPFLFLPEAGLFPLSPQPPRPCHRPPSYLPVFKIIPSEDIMGYDDDDDDEDEK